MIEHQTWVAPGEAALLAGCSRRTVLGAIRAGELPARQFNRRVILICRSDLAAWVRAAERAATGAQIAQPAHAL